ncbi:MAG TPA: DNA topoisomerase subunit B [Candidatus Woesebacteria bacterium]|nr:DNA topoisomerase subunit B [Candidatus Woesebacteria bacterium]HPJ17172.1 DNA topoisomerase subunit B [Candidatus Woesebacteria bacterium]
MSDNSSYNSDQIVVLEGLEPVRKRPAMYIGSTDTRGLHHCLTEIIDNSIDEALAGYAQNVWVIINSDNSATVADDGRGIPVDIMPKYNKPALEVIMTTLHSGGKFEGAAYKVSGGLHGVGAACVNALSTLYQVEVRREGKVNFMEFSKGKVKTPIAIIPKTNIESLESILPASVSGTTTTFYPDPEIFKETIEFDNKTIIKSLKDRAYLTSKIYFHFLDKRSGSEHHYYFEGGILSLLTETNKGKNVIHEPIYIHRADDGVDVEVAIQYNDTFQENTPSFVNIINTHEGGTHLSGFKSALTKSIKDYAERKEMVKNKDDVITGDDVREGLTAIISIKMGSKDLQFEGQTKGKLGNSEVQPIVAKIVREELDIYFEEHPDVAKTIISKALLTIQIRKAAKAAKDAIMRKGAFDSMGLPGKLADCQSKKPEECEIYIVEGDSAGGSAKQGRDRKFQAILPLWGKALNTEGMRLDKIIGSDKLKDLIIALGMGIGDTFDLAKLRYHRIILMSDADVDGAHIATLLLTFMFRHLPGLVENGHIYIAMPPLYQIKQGKKIDYVYTDEEKEAFLKKIGNVSVDIQRYKGLGEMNPEQLWTTTMNPETRILKKVTINDAQKADETFRILMSEEVPPRKKFIVTHAHLATLDI